MSMLVTNDHEMKKSLKNFMNSYLEIEFLERGAIILKEILAFSLSLFPFKTYMYSIKSRKLI